MPRKDAPWVEPVVLEGKLVRLEPIATRHARELAKHAEPDMFKHFIAGIPRDQSVSALKEFVAAHRGLPNTVSFAILPRKTLKAVGVTTYMDIRAEHKALEIGMTWIGRAWQGTAVNPECKLLLMEHAFERLGAERVQLKTDRRNLQSQHAIEKLGAVREGILRSYSIAPDGYVTDRVIYSVVAAEWPQVKLRLLTRLAALGL